MKRILVINGSYNRYGNTAKALDVLLEHLVKVNQVGYDKIFLSDCGACSNCSEGLKRNYCQNQVKPDCIHHDQFYELIEKMYLYDTIIMGSPVYLDFPSPKLLSLMSRMNFMAESTDRQYYKDIALYVVATGYCSGTKAVTHTLQAAGEMLGLNIPARSSYEWITLWKDRRLRGGDSRVKLYIPE